MFFKQKSAYEMRISDWSSDVCSSDLFFDDFGMKREVDVDEVKRCGQLGDDAFHGLLGRVCGSDISGVVFRQPDDLCRATVQLDGEFNRLARREKVTNAAVRFAKCHDDTVHVGLAGAAQR